RSPSKGKVIDKDRIQRARKQIIQCESIIRKVLAIHNCYQELRNLDSESDASIGDDWNTQRMSPLQQHVADKAVYPSRNERNGGESPLPSPTIQQGTNAQTATSSRESTPIVPRVKPVSYHIPTPVPVHGLSMLSVNAKRSLSPERPPTYFSPRPTRQSQFKDASSFGYHTPPRKRVHIGVNSYTVETETIANETERHVRWTDKSCQKPLIQGTPPPSRPLHREMTALKPCIDSPDQQTKEALEKQRIAMLEKQRTIYLEELRKRTTLY
ncbi:hypothetical protein WA538_001160, partial [Blastocystis sp. DL]